MYTSRHNRMSRFATLALLSACFVSAEGAEAVENTVGTDTAAPVAKAPGIGDIAKQLIRDGLGNKEVLEKVKEQFPDAKTSMASINWYRNNLRDNGEDVRTARELAAAGKPTAADVKAAKEKAKADEKATKDEAKAKDKADKAAAKAEAKAKEKADKAAAKEAGKAPAAGAAPSENASGDADLAAALG
jgi:hypothetical protein